MQAMVQQEIRTMFPDLFKKQTQSQYNINKIPTHTHNGLDSVRIKQIDMLQNVKYNAFFIENTVETFQFINIPSLSRIDFLGFAANNADGSPATKRAVCNGLGNFGTCLRFSGSGSTISLQTSGPGTPFVQSANFMYTDSTDLTKARVGATNEFFVYVTDGTTEVATIKILSYQNNSITMEVNLDTNWKIQGSLVLT